MAGGRIRRRRPASRLWSWSTGAGGGAVWNAITYDPETIVCTWELATRAAPMPRRMLCMHRGRAECRYRRHGMEYDTAPGDHTQCDASTDITLADDQHRWSAAQRHFLRAERRLLSRARSRHGKPSGKEVRPGLAQPFGAVVRARRQACVRAHHGTAGIERGWRCAGGFGRSALVAWDPVKQQPAWAMPTQGAFSGGVLSTAGDLVFQGQADGYLTAYSAVDGRRAWAFYRPPPRSARLSASRSANTSTSRSSTGPRRERRAASVRCPPDSVGTLARIRAACSTFVLDGTAELPPTPGPTFATPDRWEPMWSSMRRWRKRARRCLRSASGVMARERSLAVARRICGLRCRRW